MYLIWNNEVQKIGNSTYCWQYFICDFNKRLWYCCASLCLYVAFAQLKSSDVVCIIAPQKSIWTTLFPLWKIFFYFSIIVSGMIPLAVKFKVLIWQILLYQGKVLYRFSIFISVFFLIFIFQFYFFWLLAFIKFHILFFFWMYLPALTIWTCALIKVLPFLAI